MCRSQQVSEIAEDSDKSEKDSNLEVDFRSCEEFEIMAMQNNIPVEKRISKYVSDRLKKKPINRTI